MPIKSGHLLAIFACLPLIRNVKFYFAPSRLVCSLFLYSHNNVCPAVRPLSLAYCCTSHWLRCHIAVTAIQWYWQFWSYSCTFIWMYNKILTWVFETSHYNMLGVNNRRNILTKSSSSGWRVWFVHTHHIFKSTFCDHSYSFTALIFHSIFHSSLHLIPFSQLLNTTPLN